MKITIPCKFGEMNPKYNKRFIGIQWHKWMGNWEYIEIYATNNKWNPYDMEEWVGKEYNELIEIKDIYLAEGNLAKLGFPLKGTGYITGIVLRNNRTYADIIITSHYNIHIHVSCNIDGSYDNGNIIYPPTPSFETKEKREKFLLKKYMHLA